MSEPATFGTVAEAGDAFLRAYVAMYPRERAAYGFFPFGAAYMGIHDDDGRVTDYRPASVARRLAELDAWDATLAAVEQRVVTADDRTDLAILRWVRGAETFALRELAPHRSKPLHYNDTVDVSGYIRRNLRAAAMTGCGHCCVTCRRSRMRWPWPALTSTAAIPSRRSTSRRRGSRSGDTSTSSRRICWKRSTRAATGHW